MTKEITINWKSGTRRIELKIPGEKEAIHHMATAPTPLRMSPKSLGWINRTLALGTSLSVNQIEEMTVNNGYNLVTEVLAYWQENEAFEIGEAEEAKETEEKDGIQEQLEAIDLNDDGSVDVEDMR